MHTFFINTSGKEFENYADIFEIQHETRRLVSLDCPIADWCDEETGYKACVNKMGELIDSYKDINNNFNLVLYVDLLSYKEYTDIPMDKHRERYACLKALHSLLKHYIRSTMVKELDDFGRAPREVLIIFEENKAPSDGDERTEDGKNMIRAYTRELLGIPCADELNSLVYSETKKGEKEIVAFVDFCECVKQKCSSKIGENALLTYDGQLDVFLKEAQGYESADEPLKRLLDRILECSGSDDENVRSVSFITNRRAGVANKQERTRRNLRLCFYILSCIEDATIYDKKSGAVKGFPDIDWDKTASALTKKGKTYRSKYRETQRLSESFSDLGLAPKLVAFDSAKFGLDEYGNRGKVFTVVDVEKKKDEEQEQKDIEAGVIRPEGAKALEVTRAAGRNLFTSDEFTPFDYRGDNIDESILGSKAKAEQYIKEARKLREHHLDYLKRLKVHVSDVLSNYAGRSSENDPELLKKRKVSVSEDDYDDTAVDYKYAKAGTPEETKKLKTVEDISRAAYESTLIDYMEFCAGRSVAVTDIEEQCNWFITRVNQIKESLRKLGLVAIGMLAALILLYVPYVVIQFEAITKNTLTATTALLSIGIPLALLYLIFGFLSALQRRKYRKAWKEFKAKSDEILEENAVAAEKYDKLLALHIPSLRWVYEYKLDVEFYADCCKMARAKIGHHIQKLHDRIETVENIVEDLEAENVGDVDDGSVGENRDVDYNVSFCSGKKNREFYSIMDSRLIDYING